jgi:hypothetical protein
VPYDDAAWEALCKEKGFTLTIVRNIWKDMMYYTEGANWLAGRGNAMSPFSDKTMNADKVLQVTPKEFYDAYAKYTSLSLDRPVTDGRKILYECMAAEILEEVIQKLTGPTQVVDLNEAIPQYIIVFGFSAAGDPSSVMRTEVSKVIQASMHTTDYLTFDDEDNDAMEMDVLFPSIWIGSEVLWSVVCSMTLLTTSQVDVHSVLYLPPSRSLFKKPILDSAPSVHSRGGRHEADNEENPRSGCECLGRWEYHRGCACKLEPSSALHPCRLTADTSRSELHCHMYHELFSIHCHACLVRFRNPVLSAAGRYI